MNGGGVVNGQGGIQVDPSAVDRIKQALDVIYAPNSSNDTRNQAQIFLDQLKTSNEAPHYGFSLASDNSQSPIVRYYALQLLEYGIRFNWPDYSDQQKEMIRNWELVLAGNVTDSDPPYLRNKVGQLWADIAKRSWGADWQNMDELLVDLWSRGNRGQRDLCLHILETLVGDVFAREDAIAGLRNAVLSKACITVFTPVAAIPENSDTADTVARHGTEGWLGRLVVFLQECLAAGPQDSGAADCASRVLAALKACVTWISPRYGCITSASLCIADTANCILGLLLSQRLWRALDRPSPSTMSLYAW
jgi:exportin-5